MTFCHGDFRVALLYAQKKHMWCIDNLWICGMKYRNAEVSTHACFSLIAFIKQLVKDGRADQIESRYRNSSLNLSRIIDVRK